jgi:hypothetical protein
VAKPAATEIEADGSITSKGHVRQGAKMARQILWSLNVPFHQRERLSRWCSMAVFPSGFGIKLNPQRAVIKASQVIQCDLLALLAEADVRGRQCDDQLELLERVQFFRNFVKRIIAYFIPARSPQIIVDLSISKKTIAIQTMLLFQGATSALECFLYKRYRLQPPLIKCPLIANRSD